MNPGTAPSEDRSSIAADAPLADLILRCQAGDDAAKAAFFNAYAPLLNRAVAHTLSTFDAPPLRSEVEDIANALFERLLRNDCRMLSTLRNPKRIDAWLVTVARNHTVDYVRKWAAQQRALDALANEENSATCQNLVDQPDHREQNDAVRALIAALPDFDRLILELFYQQGRTYAEIAEITSRNIQVIATRLHRAKQRLRAKLLQNALDKDAAVNHAKEHAHA
jgi:RNA polymerase sigma-70 factor (ECF subfamily)